MNYNRHNNNKNTILSNQGYLVEFKFCHSVYAARKNDRFNIPKIKGHITMNKDMIKVKVDKSELFDFNARVIYKIVTKMEVNK